MATNLVISGGPLHDFAASTDALVGVLEGEGLRCSVVEDPRAGLRELVERPGAWDVVTVNALAWRAGAERHAHLRDEWAFTLHDDESLAIDRYVRGGGALLACHAAVICFDGDPRWAACLGATWNWDGRDVTGRDVKGEVLFARARDGRGGVARITRLQ